ncbi:MAG: hypothetical protein K2X11_07985 [Acetobacteraceae bacterium]|nr:hypothetical protein [Acetobacteraceae bacterium]
MHPADRPEALALWASGIPRRLRPLVRSLFDEAAVRTGGRLLEEPDRLGLAAPAGHPAVARTAAALRDMATFSVGEGEPPARPSPPHEARPDVRPRHREPDGAPEGAPEGAPGGAPDGASNGTPWRHVTFFRGAEPVAQYLAVTLSAGRDPDGALAEREAGSERLLGELATGRLRLAAGLPLLLDMPVARFRGRPRDCGAAAPMAVLPLAALGDAGLGDAGLALRVAAWRAAGWRFAWRGPAAALA